jgi:integrase
VAALVVPAAGSLLGTGSGWEPYRLVGPDGAVVGAVSAWFRDLRAAGRSAATVRSYGMDLLRWFRFLWAIGPPWEQATRAEARDFCLWLLIAGKPGRAGRRGVGEAYAVSVRVHSETVLRGFYGFHLDAGTGPIVNPFPLARPRRDGRANAHHNPMEPYRDQRAGLYRPRVPRRVPRSIPDEEFDEIFARLPSHRDRALVAFYVSTGARASRLLSVTQGGADPGRQVIAVVRKEPVRCRSSKPRRTRSFGCVASETETQGLVPRGRRQPLWWTLRPPAYHAVHRMFERAAVKAGSAATLHALRHTAACRMAEDPNLPLTDVQFVLGHARLTTTQIYLTPRHEDVIRRVLAHHAGQVRQAAGRRVPAAAPGYRPETLDVLFGGDPR